MKRHLKSAAALLVCLSGWALLPFTSLPSQVFGWELFAEAYGEIFSDGFESGDTSAWSNVVGELELFDVDSPDELTATFRLDARLWKLGGDEVVPLMAGTSVEQLPVFRLEARTHRGALQLRVRAFNETVIWSESPWRTVSRRYEVVALEWRRAYPGLEDGLVYLSVDDDLLLWLVDLDNELLPLRTVEVAHLGKRRAVELQAANMSSRNRNLLMLLEAEAERAGGQTKE